MNASELSFLTKKLNSGPQAEDLNLLSTVGIQEHVIAAYSHLGEHPMAFKNFDANPSFHPVKEYPNELKSLPGYCHFSSPDGKAYYVALMPGFYDFPENTSCPVIIFTAQNQADPQEVHYGFFPVQIQPDGQDPIISNPQIIDISSESKV